MIFNNVITVYNYHKNPVSYAENWLRTVIKGVQWEQRQEKTVAQNGVINFANVFETTIPFEADTGGKIYIDLNSWRQLSTEELGLYWTIDAVSNMSLIALGGIEKEITDEYTITDLRRDCANIAVMSSVTDATNAPYLKHWKIGGK